MKAVEWWSTSWQVIPIYEFGRAELSKQSVWIIFTNIPKWTTVWTKPRARWHPSMKHIDHTGSWLFIGLLPTVVVRHSGTGSGDWLHWYSKMGNSVDKTSTNVTPIHETHRPDSWLFIGTLPTVAARHSGTGSGDWLQVTPRYEFGRAESTQSAQIMFTHIPKWATVWAKPRLMWHPSMTHIDQTVGSISACSPGGCATFRYPKVIHALWMTYSGLQATWRAALQLCLLSVTNAAITKIRVSLIDKSVFSPGQDITGTRVRDWLYLH